MPMRKMPSESVCDTIEQLIPFVPVLVITHNHATSPTTRRDMINAISNLAW
ncbi:MAG: hypothetical protein ACODAD_08540 [Planctomycetota bacterium]